MGPVMGIGLCTTEQINFLEVKSQAIMRIKKAYDANNIMILFPIRTIDFGIKGGVPLTDMMKNS
ncbi:MULTISPECIES: hypothetical protein [unclassified Mucilaginibacter]|nr:MULTISPECIES: hypothetical protein [unclassified Mucilaginibacter]MEB0277659.1 hypothetical protein [Mucilaginibacter sp. 10B2]MEB0299574.1 hypothetical protein [Mucilaginibacter sp. 5C4]WPX24713.1 hypothetical protein RHM67_05440 [Mucilaginibacter sp. 5C4]